MADPTRPLIQSVEMPGCGHLVQLSVPMTMTDLDPEPGYVAQVQLTVDRDALRTAMLVHVRNCEQSGLQ